MRTESEASNDVSQEQAPVSADLQIAAPPDGSVVQRFRVTKQA
jgi:hypothetical protein